MRVISQCLFKFDVEVKIGGRLRVFHQGGQRFFDFGSGPINDSSIHWAAFSSHCEHEVLPVTSGHRITLTYQLYVSEHLGDLVHPLLPTADPKLYPIYQSIKEMLSLPTDMKNSGTLGFRCAHQYPDHTEGTYDYGRIPCTLKGTNVALFTMFRTIDLIVHMQPAP